VIFNRDAWIGFESDELGKITFGRQNALARDYSGIYGDPYGSAAVTLEEGGYTNTNNFKQLIYYAAGIGGGTRVDRGINWKKKAGDFLFGAAYAVGNVTDQFSKNGTGSLGVAWNGGAYNASGYFTQVNVANKVHRAYSIGGNVQLIPLVRLNVGYFHYTAEQAAALGNRSDNAFTISTKLTPSTDYDFELGYQSMQAKDASQTGTGLTANTQNAFKDASAATVKGSGNRNTIYGSAFYHLSKKAEVYLAGDYLTTTGNYKVAGMNGKSNQTELVTGLRYKF
jgi:predicted porin